MLNSTLLRSGLRVLVVDSSSDSCELLTILFSLHGVETITATCVAEAIDKIQQSPPDLLISEIILPNEDGYSLMQKVKTLETTSRATIPAIALTACAGTLGRIRALASGFCEHLPKPVDVDELLETVACLKQ